MYDSKASGFHSRENRSISPQNQNAQTPVAKYLQQNKRINDSYNRQAIQSFSAQKIGNSLDFHAENREGVPPSMFSTASKFSPQDYEVNLSPDNNCFGKYRQVNLDQTYRDRKRMQESKPRSMIRLQKQEANALSNYA